MHLDLVGTSEIADRCEVEHVTVRQWRARGHLPDPGWVIGRRPIWDWDDLRDVAVIVRSLAEARAKTAGATT